MYNKKILNECNASIVPGGPPVVVQKENIFLWHIELLKLFCEGQGPLICSWWRCKWNLSLSLLRLYDIITLHAALAIISPKSSWRKFMFFKLLFPTFKSVVSTIRIWKSITIWFLSLVDALLSIICWRSRYRSDHIFVPSVEGSSKFLLLFVLILSIALHPRLACCLGISSCFLLSQCTQHLLFLPCHLAIPFRCYDCHRLCDP